MNNFTHINKQGHAKMVDVTNKTVTKRTAVATSSIQLNEEIKQMITHKQSKKGDILQVSQVAGIMAAKETSKIIPMCHPLMLGAIDIHFEWDNDNPYILHIESTVTVKGETGVEMEALTAASVTALTIYDMCKAVNKSLIIGPTYLLEKTGGKSGHYKHSSQH